ncbi:unnamed protein product [Lampetra planeri]
MGIASRGCRVEFSHRAVTLQRGPPLRPKYGKEERHPGHGHVLGPRGSKGAAPATAARGTRWRKERKGTALES